jgi:hypothetical protein
MGAGWVNDLLRLGWLARPTWPEVKRARLEGTGRSVGPFGTVGRRAAGWLTSQALDRIGPDLA